MGNRYPISLNFLPINQEAFYFNVYRLESSGQEEFKSSKNISKKTLPENHRDVESRRDYWVSFSQVDDFNLFECQSHYNHIVSRDFLHIQLLRTLRQKHLQIEFEEHNSRFEKNIFFILQTYPEGREVISLQSYYLKAKEEFGFLIDFRFQKNEDTPFSKRVQQLSLSLDKYGKENRSFYSDKYNKIQYFVNKFIDHIFPLEYEPNSIDINSKLTQITADTLDKKIYVFRNEKTCNSQFVGVKRFSPLSALSKTPKIFFVFRQKDRLLSLDLYKSLRGDKFPSLFPGTETFFGFPMSRQNVEGITISSFEEGEIELARDKIIRSGSSPCIALLIAPWNREEDEDSEDYYRTKHTFASAQIPSQVVRRYTLEKDSRLQWSTSNIALQCFVKLGGMPWKVRPRHNRCLIIGVGQSHRESFENGRRRIEKYYAYSVLTDSSGLFKELRILSRSDKPQEYIDQLSKSIETIVGDYSDEFDSYVIHAPYKIKEQSLEAIKNTLEDLGSTGKQFVVLKINQKNKFFGYSPTNNSLVPFESTFVKIAWNEYLVWFEGLQYNKPKVTRRYSNPIHITFYYSNSELSHADHLGYLQDAVNLSGANWRGFNAKSIPVSMYYAQLIARFNSKFEELNLPEINLNNLVPWFL